MYIYIFISRFIFKKKFLQRIKIIEAVKKNNTKKMIDPVTTYLSHLLVKVYHLSTAKQKYISQAYENNKLFFLLLIHNSPCQILLSKSIGANNNMLVWYNLCHILHAFLVFHIIKNILRSSKIVYIYIYVCEFRSI